MSGYQKSPDYGGRPATWRGLVIWGAVIIVLGLSIVQCSTKPDRA
jgi:hypothetical protein